jgi:glycosyltransferase involved in cell wall biosynthesis
VTRDYKSRLKENMKILLISTSPFYIVRGTPLRTRIFVEGYLKNNYELDILTYPVGEDLHRDRARIFRPQVKFYTKTTAGPSWGKILIDFFMLGSGIQLCRENEYDLIHCEDSEAVLIGMVLKRIFRKKIVGSFHNRLSDNLAMHRLFPLVAPAKVIEKYLYRGVDFIITNKDNFADYVKKRYGVRNVATVYDFVSDQESEPATELPEKYLVYAGNSEAYQGVPLLINSFSRISEKLPDLSLFLVGHMGDDIKKMVAQKVLKERVVITGVLSLEETNYLLKRSVFNVIPSIIRGPIPQMKTLQYITAGRPVLATDVDSNRIFLENMRNAYLVEPDLESIADGMSRLLEDSELRETIIPDILDVTGGQDVSVVLSGVVESLV